ncbi:MAG: beta-ketoacyl-[acyl-carrier-protein] synthase family protein [Gammaproteobacteria bacterium]|nr:beta-ketoacyl-[acyl-carrier-protein] synthase family protein [Gammaproteobacteria bacterium]
MATTARSVVVTGFGCISALGHNSSQFWDKLKAGQTGISKTTYPSRQKLGDAPVAEVKDYDPKKYFDAKSIRILDPNCQFAIIAADEAVQHAGINFTPDTGSRTGIIIGTGVASRESTDEILEQYYKHNKSIPPYTLPKGLHNSSISNISIKYGITGPSWIVNTACASSNHAFGQAMELIRQNRADIMLAGGTETPLSVPFFKAWEALRILDPVTCRPFSKDRQGLVLGEGSGIVVLEEEQHALKRGAKIYCRLSGYGFSTDAYDIMKVSPEGAARAVREALSDASLRTEDIDYINAHGTGTIINDQAETKIIHDVFGEHADQLLISSTKSMHGHTLGAAGSLELIATILAMTNECIPPTINFTGNDESCDLDYVPNKSRHKKIKSAISHNFAFGGLNAVIAVTCYS